MPGLLGTSLNTDDILETLRGIGRGLNFGGTSGMIGAPVDMVTAVLNNPGLLHPGLLGVQGLGIKDPVGGSKWIEQKLQGQGLLPKRQGNWQEGVGELASTFINPMTAAAVAGPKLYAAEQRAIENAMAPTTLNKQAGAIVWHGSPYKFDKFDASKIGTGEGAQAYGHGLYLAESPDVAGSYAQSVKANSGELVKRGAEHGLPEDVASNLAAALQGGKKFDPVLDAARKMIDDPLAIASQRAAAQRLIDNEMAAYNAWSEWSKPGQLYKVDLPDEHIAKMLDWDKPLSQQPKAVRKAVEPIVAPIRKEMAKPTAAGWGDFAAPQKYDPTGAEVLALLRQQKDSGAQGILGNGLGPEVSQRLRDAGIPGIRYLDGGSRGAGSGTSNFVVFPGNEDLLRILERNGQPIGLLGR